MQIAVCVRAELELKLKGLGERTIDRQIETERQDENE